MRPSTLTGWAVWVLLAKNHRFIGRLRCQRGTIHAVSRSFSAYKSRFALSPTISLIILAALGTQPGGTSTSRALNSLSTIAGHEGEEEDWDRLEREVRDLNREDDEVSTVT